MANTSASGGYLTPAGIPTPADEALEDILQPMVVGITGLPGKMVRPRWQPGNPKQPEPNTNWCAIGVMHTKQDANPAIEHDGTGDGADQYQRHQDVILLATFYGPNAQAYGQLLSDGMYVPQNGEALRALNMAFVEAGELIAAPDLINQQWVRRYDLRIRLRRKIERTYPVLNILSADTPVITG
ncbi:hypothetical protein N7414_01025 [Pseudomonas sp. GD04087]|uniref:phage neck terminator protein n=1 Tax=unclassified Pseudomonas TaxID=196821 RepID=UPI0024497148|nr:MULTISPECIES: hypothetical protein [unclassified Pseudomonas]MDH0287680.1 hypothetical protein [Pseudomonas sp. GD04087]MDH1050895.1 hypothetical protein [Pseudomonas sp. GD03903]MDH1999868.1 hypothetical protein [Pseudomonas sp. GD03691]